MMIQKAPFKLPQGFLTAFGYRKGKRFVGLYWEPSGDEACYHDGEWGACGCCDNWLFLDFIRQGDEVEKFILLSHGHDGSLAVRIGFTPIRVVCQNTLSMAHGSDASKLIRVKHTREIHENLANIREVMDVANAEFEATAEQYRRLARKSINQSDLRKYVKKVLKVEDNQEGSTRLKNIMEEIVGLAEAGRGNDMASIRGTYWSAYNGMAEWLGYSRGNSQDNRLNALWFGDGANLNRHALVTALEMAG